MAVTLFKVGRTPQQPQFGLDQFTEHYKCNEAADVVLTDAGVPQKGDAHPDYQFMFVTDRYCTETGQSASALDLVYMGCLTDDGGETPLPVLPPSRHRYGSAVQTATSGLPLQGAAPASPITLDFMAQTSELVFWSYNELGALDTAPDPDTDPIIIDLRSNDTAYSPGSIGIDAIVRNFFMLRTTDTITPNEIVSGKFWENTELKTLFYGSLIFSAQVFGGQAFALFNPGRDYAVSDSLTLTDGGDTATILVASVGARDSITDFTVSANTITAATFKLFDATGGTGTGAQFVVIDFP